MIKHQYLMAMALFVLSACSANETPTANQQQQNRIFCQEPRPMICTMDYQAVCGEKKDQTKKSYSNACSACSNPEVVSYVPDACPQ